MKPTKEEVEFALKEWSEISDKNKRFMARSLEANDDLQINDLEEMATAFEAERQAHEKYQQLSKAYFGFRPIKRL